MKARAARSSAEDAGRMSATGDASASAIFYSLAQRRNWILERPGSGAKAKKAGGP